MAANTFEEKSDKTFESAELLVKNNHKNSSIHCYYYSCLQLLNHFLCDYCRYTERDIGDLANDKESHNKVISHVKEKLNERNINSITVFSELNLIKKQRAKADYGMAFVIDTDYTKKKAVFFRENFKLLLDEF